MQKKFLLILIYLLSYCLIVFICSLFQWKTECNFILSNCSINTAKLNSILQTTAPIITPIVLIWGYFTWREQEVYKKSQEIIATILTQTYEIHKTWNKSRVYSNTFSRFDAYCLKDLIPMSPEILENSELSEKEFKRLTDVHVLLNDLHFSLNHLHLINKKLNIDKISNEIDIIEDELATCMNELATFQSQLISIKYNYTNLMQPEQKIKDICHKLDSTSHPLGRIDNYGKRINSIFKKISDEITILSDSF